jgi:hypothetical protein
MRAPLTGAFLLLALSTSAHAHQFEKLDTSKGKFFAGLGLRLGL